MIRLEYHSPEEQVTIPLANDQGQALWVKRDDLIHPFISGNKWRKLKYLLQKAKDQDKRHMVTFGGAWSNHLLATACAGAKFGFKTTGLVRGEEVRNPLLQVCALFGMELIFVSREAYRDKATLFEARYEADEQAFFIDEGGASAEGVQGCAELVDELEQEYDHIFCACGTGTTAAGILKGLQKQNAKTLFHAIPVLKNGSFMQAEIDQWFDIAPGYALHTDYHFGGYAKTTQKLLSYMQEIAAATGLLTDPIYTAKVFAAVKDLAEKGFFNQGEKILVIHTGGLFGLLGKLDEFKLPAGYML